MLKVVSDWAISAIDFFAATVGMSSSLSHEVANSSVAAIASGAKRDSLIVFMALSFWDSALLTAMNHKMFKK